MAVKLHFETLAPGMNAKLDAKFRARRTPSQVLLSPLTSRRPARHGSINCMLADNLKMPYNRTQA
jgi:hypothetical protein